jgi:hypothetical protein
MVNAGPGGEQSVEAFMGAFWQAAVYLLYRPALDM